MAPTLHAARVTFSHGARTVLDIGVRHVGAAVRGHLDFSNVRNMINANSVRTRAVLVAVAVLATTAAGCSSTKPSSSASSSTSAAAAVTTAAPAASTTVPPTTTAPFTSPVARATVSGPVSGGKGSVVIAPSPALPGQAATVLDLTTVGYTETEYFLSGTATAYTSDTPLISDGAWKVREAATAPYTTRVVVRRPKDAAKFNGTVIVEWLNVTGGLDAGPDWTYMQPEILRSGYAWVGVSAQRVGVEGGGIVLGENRVLKVFDPARYGSLSHPGDNFSYDMFSQSGAAVRRDTAALLGDLKPTYVVAMGESQSASRLTTYIDAIAPTAKVFDGYFVHSRSGNASPLAGDPLPAVPAPLPTLIRTDLGVPVLTFSSETDVAGPRGYRKAAQPDTATFRSWEVAGTAHADSYNLGGGGFDNGDGKTDATYFASMLTPPNNVYSNLITCATGINTGPHTYVLRAALKAFDTWVRTKQPPPSMPLFEVDGTGNAYAVDAAGNAKGAIRTPYVDVPIATLGGLGQTGNAFCSLFGSTVPFDAVALKARYGSHDAFVTQWTTAMKKAVDAGVILQVDADHLIAAAKGSTVGN